MLHATGPARARGAARRTPSRPASAWLTGGRASGDRQDSSRRRAGPSRLGRGGSVRFGGHRGLLFRWAGRVQKPEPDRHCQHESLCDGVSFIDPVDVVCSRNRLDSVTGRAQRLYGFADAFCHHDSGLLCTAWAVPKASQHCKCHQLFVGNPRALIDAPLLECFIWFDAVSARP